MDNSGGTNSTLVALDPPQTLLFSLERNTSPKTVLKVTNTSKSKVIFKVKTTQPSWYYVRPNQQVLDVGKSEDVIILLVEHECNRFLAQAAGDAEEKLDKHRFLVQSKIVEDGDYAAIQELPAAERVAEFSRIWDGQGDNKRNTKLKVEFRYPSNLHENLPGDTSRNNNAGEAVRKALARATETSSSPIEEADQLSHSSNNMNTTAAAAAAAATNPNVLLAELQALRKKFDAVVEYTVHLTAERDSIFTQLEGAQRELIKEKAKKKTSSSSGLPSTEGITGTVEKTEKKAEKQQGFSLFMVILAALLSFLIGKYLSS